MFPAEGATSGGAHVRFTAKANTLYAHLLEMPSERSFVIYGDDFPPIDRAVHLASGEAVEFRRVSGGVEITLPRAFDPAPALAFALTLSG